MWGFVFFWIEGRRPATVFHSPFLAMFSVRWKLNEPIFAVNSVVRLLEVRKKPIVLSARDLPAVRRATGFEMAIAGR